MAGPLTWRNVDAPDFRGSLSGLSIANDAISRAVGGLSEGLGQFDAARRRDAESAVLNASMNYADPAALRAAIADGSIFQGVDRNLLGREALAAVDGRAGALLNQATSQQALSTARELDPLRIDAQRELNQHNVLNYPIQRRQGEAAITSSLAAAGASSAAAAATRARSQREGTQFDWTVQDRAADQAGLTAAGRVLAEGGTPEEQLQRLYAAVPEGPQRARAVQHYQRLSAGMPAPGAGGPGATPGSFGEDGPVVPQLQDTGLSERVQRSLGAVAAGGQLTQRMVAPQLTGIAGRYSELLSSQETPAAVASNLSRLPVFSNIPAPQMADAIQRVQQQLGPGFSAAMAGAIIEQVGQSDRGGAFRRNTVGRLGENSIDFTDALNEEIKAIREDRRGESRRQAENLVGSQRRVEALDADVRRLVTEVANEERRAGLNPQNATTLNRRRAELDRALARLEAGTQAHQERLGLSEFRPRERALSPGEEAGRRPPPVSTPPAALTNAPLPRIVEMAANEARLVSQARPGNAEVLLTRVAEKYGLTVAELRAAMGQ